MDGMLSTVLTSKVRLTVPENNNVPFIVELMILMEYKMICQLCLDSSICLERQRVIIHNLIKLDL
jgi:hypothetical protein